MRKMRFFYPGDLSMHATVELDPELSHYINRVLRLKIDSEIFLFNNTNCEYQAIIANVARNRINVLITGQRLDAQSTPLNITLAQVLAKGEKMDLIIQKATELGVSTVVPLFSVRTVIRNVAERVENKLEHWQKIAIAACAQSWRNNLPVIHAPQQLQSWLPTTSNGNNIILTPHTTQRRLRDLPPQQQYTILVGPEGGFSDEEVNLAIASNFIPVTLGSRILRTETAGLASIAAIQAMYGDG